MSPSGRAKLAAPDYASLVRRIRRAVDVALPEGAHVLVVGKGDREIAKLGRRTVAQFPQDASGEYAGHHPSDAESAIRQIESLRAAGAQYILFPSTAYWWFEHYGPLHRYLDERCEQVNLNTDVCRIWEISGARPSRVLEPPRTSLPEAPAAAESLEIPSQPLDARVRELLAALLDQDTTIVHLRERGQPALSESDFAVHSLAAPTPDDREFSDALASMRSLGAEVLLVLGGAPQLGWLDDESASIRALLDRSLPRIAHREHLCTLYDLSGGGTSPVGSDHPSDGHSHAEA